MKLDEILELADERDPVTIEYREADAIHVKAIRFDEERPSVGDQHMHMFDHVSVVVGPFRVYIGDGNGIPDDASFFDIGGKGQPFTVRIPAHRFHRFISLDPGGILLCIANHHGEQQPIVEKHAGRLKG